MWFAEPSGLGPAVRRSRPRPARQPGRFPGFPGAQGTNGPEPPYLVFGVNRQGYGTPERPIETNAARRL
ncbi:hypothetical protein ACKVV1_011520 [Pyricularia oryzae]